MSIKLRRVTSAGFIRKKSNKIADACVESKVKSGDEEEEVQQANTPCEKVPLRLRLGLTSPRRRRNNRASACSPTGSPEDFFEEALSKRKIKPIPSSPEPFDLNKHAHQLFVFLRKHEQEAKWHWYGVWSPGNEDQSGVDFVVNDAREQLDIDMAYTVYAMQSIGRVHVCALQGALVVTTCLDLSCLPMVIYSDRWNGLLKAVFAAALVASPYVLCRLNGLADVESMLTTKKAFVVSAAYLIVGLSVEVVLAQVADFDTVVPQLLLAALLVVFTANFHLPLRYSSVVTLGLVAFGSLANSPRIDQAMTTAALLLLAVLVLFKLEKRSRADFALGLKKFKELELGADQTTRDDEGTSDYVCEQFQDTFSELSRQTSSSSRSCTHGEKGSSKTVSSQINNLAKLHSILKTLKAKVALNDYVHIESTISLALGVLETLEVPETSMLATYKRCYRKSEGVIDSFLETEIGGGRLATALAMESGTWSEGQKVTAGDPNDQTPVLSKRRILPRSSSSSGIPANHIQARVSRELLKNRSTSERLITSSTVLKSQMHALQQLMLDWNFGEGGIFARLQDTSGALPSSFSRSPLTLSTIASLKLFGVLEKLNLDEDKMWKLLQQIEEQYGAPDEVPYHNAVHACDVVQSVTYLVSAGDLLGDLPTVALLSLLFGAASHDVGHPGTNNSFHVNTLSELAITYSDRSVLEHYHLSLAFRTLRQPQCDITKELSKGKANVFRELVIEMVLGTDIANHYSNLATFKSSVAATPHRPSREQPVLNTKSSIKCKALLHCADVGSVAKDWEIYHQWIDLLFEEFYKQGEIERSLGLVTASFMDRGISSPAKAQQGFIKCIAMEVFTAMSDWLPNLKPVLVDSALTNIQHLESLRIVEQEQRAASTDISKTL